MRLTNWHFCVEMIDKETGRQEIVVVELDAAEQWRVLSNLHCWPCVLNRAASDRARAMVGEDFDCQAIAPVVLH